MAVPTIQSNSKPGPLPRPKCRRSWGREARVAVSGAAAWVSVGLAGIVSASTARAAAVARRGNLWIGLGVTTRFNPEGGRSLPLDTAATPAASPPPPHKWGGVMRLRQDRVKVVLV